MYTYTHLEDFIQNVFRKLNINSPYELNPYSIADSLGIGLYPISTESHQAIQFEGKQYIFLNNHLTSYEQFEVFGHELGHILLHTRNQRSMKVDYRSYQEWKANLFSLYFCIPTFMLQRLPAAYLNKYEISETFGVTTAFACKRLNLHRQRYYTIKHKNHCKGGDANLYPPALRLSTLKGRYTWLKKVQNLRSII